MSESVRQLDRASGGTEGTEGTVLTQSNGETETNREEFQMYFWISPFASVPSLLCVKAVSSVLSVASAAQS